MMNKKQIEQSVTAFCAAAAANTLDLPTHEPAWGGPIVGVAAGDDPFFQRFKEDIGPFYWTPLEVFRQAYPQRSCRADELRVISYVLPQTDATRTDQRHATALPAERWVRSRYFGELFNEALRDHLVELLVQSGYPAVAPARQPGFSYRQSPRFGIASNWSERHTAFVAGLGTFGLSDGLITPLGKAVRLGSVVTALQLPLSPRPYGDDPHAYCLHYARGICRACAGRCPAQVIGLNGHDKDGCAAYIRNVTAPHSRETYGIDATPCGLCQVKIPCEAGIPAALQKAFSRRSEAKKS
ncbi:MAG: 4Fe-4S ferredoxin [Desulfuromonadaceae bacterium]|nr:4Fe-4S ferredoxin [Desulfuromonadaceae bacterium]